MCLLLTPLLTLVGWNVPGFSVSSSICKYSTEVHVCWAENFHKSISCWAYISENCKSFVGYMQITHSRLAKHVPFTFLITWLAIVMYINFFCRTQNLITLSECLQTVSFYMPVLINWCPMFGTMQSCNIVIIFSDGQVDV